MQEFSKLTPDNTVYKMIGPVLVPQEQVEAKGNIDKRLEFIKGDMCVFYNTRETSCLTRLTLVLQ